MAVCIGHFETFECVHPRPKFVVRISTECFRAQISSFRHAVLQQNPMLLDSLLRKAIESESGHEKVEHDQGRMAANTH